MKLSQLIINCPLVDSVDQKLQALFDLDISNIASNSKAIQPNGLFIASKGLDADGHHYIKDAFKNGAVAVVAQNNPENLDNVILVKNSRLATAAIAAQFYGHPSNDMTLIGITGTNGKTTITWLIESICKACEYPTGVIGTVNVRYNGILIENPYTTPDAIYLQKTLKLMKDAGVTHVILEVSSHGLELNRVDYCKFDIGVFTNLTQDHMDFHRNMNEYFECKKRLFTHFLNKKTNKNARAVINLDNSKGQALFSSLNCNTIGVSAEQNAQVCATDIKDTIDGLSANLCFDDHCFSFCSSLTGTFNLENILCAAGAAHALDIDLDRIKTGLEQCQTIPGRLEKIENSIDRHLFIDYAHTPDALESVLTTLSKRAPKRIITVFGCGGDRDAKKRPLMGQATCKNSHITIVTSDNPRSEDPDAIINDIIEGLNDFESLKGIDIEQSPFKKGYLVQTDRKKAIQLAVNISKPKDIIIVAGKGHETYQITNAGKIHFDDKEELQKASQTLWERFQPIAWTVEDFHSALNTDATISNLKTNFTFSGISTDSRAIKSSELFVALKGDNFDGNTFVLDLAQKGIKGFIVQKGLIASIDKESADKIKQKELVLFETPDTLISLGKLAQFQRLRSKVNVLAITGSSGKTTTRKITQQIFNTRFHTLATMGNLNNEIGVPLTLLKLSAAHEWAIIEMGMNHAGEISRLSQIARPDIAMVINTDGVHLEGLGTVENVAKAKAEIFEGLRENSTAIIFSDDKRRHILKEKIQSNKNIEKLLLFGSDIKADICLSTIIAGVENTDFKAQINKENTKFSIPSPARFMVDNCLAAISAAFSAGIGTECMKKGISGFTPETGRLNIYKTEHDINLIDDTYNANPTSVTQALNTLISLATNNNSIAILGDMLELGEQSAQLHKTVGQTVAQLKISKLFVFGPMGEHTIKGAIENGYSPNDIFEGTKTDIAKTVAQIANKDTWILIKGSRGMAMETVIQEFKKNINAQF